MLNNTDQLTPAGTYKHLDLPRFNVHAAVALSNLDPLGKGAIIYITTTYPAATKEEAESSVKRLLAYTFHTAWHIQLLEIAGGDPFTDLPTTNK